MTWRALLGLFSKSPWVFAVAALVASGAQAQPSVVGILNYRYGDASTTGGVPSGVYCQPAYPEVAQKAGAEGWTRLKLAIAADGRVDTAVVVDSAGSTPAHKLLDQAAVQASTGCRMYTPRFDATGQAIPFTTGMAWRWSLHGPPPGAKPPKLSSVDASCQPIYPPAAVRAGAQGDTVLRLSIDAAGHARSVDVVRSAGDSPEHKLLDQAAAEALPRCPYVPGTDIEGKPVGSTVDVSYRWKLEP